MGEIVNLKVLGLPPNYNWLYKEGGPHMLEAFIGIYGISETEGIGDNPVILGWAKELGIEGYAHDSIAWCGLAMAKIAHDAEKPIVSEPLWAANWAHWGNEVTLGPKLGDTCIAHRTGGNHVFLYLGEDDKCYHAGAGNQGNKVSIARIAKERVWSVRNYYAIGAPDNRRKILLNHDGTLKGL